MANNKTPGTAEDRRTVTVRDFCAAVGMSPNHVYKHIERGDIPAFQFGPRGKYLIPKTFLQKITGDGDAR